MNQSDSSKNFRSSSTNSPKTSNVETRRQRRRIKRRVPVTLLSLMLAWSYDPSLQDAPMEPHLAASADEQCLTFERTRAGDHLALSSDALAPVGNCTVDNMPLVRETMLGSGSLFSDLELSNVDAGGLSAQEVKIKLGVGRDLFAGLHLAIDGTLGRLLNSTLPTFDEQGHVSLTRAFNGRWDTGLEGHVGSLGGISITQLTERNTLAFVRARYSEIDIRGDEHRGEMKLSADTVQGLPDDAGRHARADFRYEYHRDSNILSVGLSIVDTEHSPVERGNPSLRLDLSAVRHF